MNAVEIEAAISDLASQPFDRVEFPYAFLQAFGNKETTLKRLRSGETNKSDLGGVLQAKNIHLLVTALGKVRQGLDALKASPATSRGKVRFILATDGTDFEAEDLESSDTVACSYPDFPDHFGFFLSLAGISTVKQIRESSFDIRATSRLNRLYLELLKDNPDWGHGDRRHEMNHFLARLIFCFFAEDTDIFQGEDLFTGTIERMSERDSSNTHEVIGEIFRSMNVKRIDRTDSKLPRWTDSFPYVNGDLFSGKVNSPKFSKIARTYLLHVGKLDWTKINPDIFGSMIQAVADDEERGALGMHYTSVPNILKVLDPLFLDDLRAQLTAAGDNARMLLNLRKRIAGIRVFDPACGSGNFLVIAYKQLRALEQEINKCRGEPGLKSKIFLTNFRGIELRDFPAEIARLALIIAEYQCNLLYLGQQEALAVFLPLESRNWITCGNALKLDWLSLFSPTGTAPVQYTGDLFEVAQPQLDFENEGGETFICGNPPYLGSTWQTDEQKADLEAIFDKRTKTWKSLDYVSGWFMKAAMYGTETKAAAAFVSTNSICQGQQVPILWPLIFKTGHRISFAHTSFKWANLASHNAGVTVVIVGLAVQDNTPCRLYSIADKGSDDLLGIKKVEHINAYLSPGANVMVEKASSPLCEQAEMSFGNKPVDGGHLLLSKDEVEELGLSKEQNGRFIRRIYGSAEFIRGHVRYCLWIEDCNLEDAMRMNAIRHRVDGVRAMRLASRDSGANEMAGRAHQMREMNIATVRTLIVPGVSSEGRNFLPVGLLDSQATVSNLAFALFDAPVWNMALIASRLHLIWIATVCGKLETRYRYSNTMGWNTFPLPALTEKNKSDLTRCAEDILLAREAHFPATIADLYDPETMPANLRAAHERNDEVLERIYIGRRFRNDTERLEKLFDLYTKMTAGGQVKTAVKVAKIKRE